MNNEQPPTPDPRTAPASSNPFSTPLVPATGAPGDFPQQGDATGGLIPYKNPHALIAYYLGIFSLFPLIGMPLGIAAIILGIIGLRKRNRNPVIKGSAHAIIGIVGGVFSVLCGGGLIVAIIFSIYAENP